MTAVMTTRGAPLTSYTLCGCTRDLFRPAVRYKLLLAIENDDNARAAIRATDALARRGAVPSVVWATDVPAPIVPTGEMLAIGPEVAFSPEYREQQAETVRNMIHSTLRRDCDWPISTPIGDPAATIAFEAKAERAEAMVMGIHHHGKFAQALGENTATRVMSNAEVPVFGVRPDVIPLPRRIMVATDFGDASIEAAHLAANLVDPGGKLILVHVTLPYPLVEEGDEGAARVQHEGIAGAFEKLTAELNVGRAIYVETVTRTGDAATQLMAAAQEIAPDMIAIARQRQHLLTRVLLGSVTREIVRDGHWSMLVIPPRHRKHPRR